MDLLSFIVKNIDAYMKSRMLSIVYFSRNILKEISLDQGKQSKEISLDANRKYLFLRERRRGAA